MTENNTQPTPGGKEIDSALVEIQKKLPTLSKDGTNTFLQGQPKYVTLGNLTDVLFPVLAEKGLNYTVFTDVRDGQCVLEARLTHAKTSQFYRAVFPVKDGTPQQVGAAITYYRRYGLSALTGVVADSDDDGNTASAQVSPAIARQQVVNPPAAKSRPKHQMMIATEFIESGEKTREEVNALSNEVKAELPDLTGDDHFKEVYNRLKASGE